MKKFGFVSLMLEEIEVVHSAQTEIGTKMAVLD